MKPIIVSYGGNNAEDCVCFDLTKVLWYRFNERTSKLNIHFSDGSELNIDYLPNYIKELNKSFQSLATK
jgi:hypothetical protein